MVNTLKASGQGESLANLIRHGLGGTDLRIFDFPSVTVPSGNSKAWSIPDRTVPEQARAVSAIEGVVIGSYRTRGYWPAEGGRTDNNKPPTCKSDDAEHGYGAPGGNCKECPLSQWGPRVNGKSSPPPCKEFVHLLILEKDSLLPINLRVPGTSQDGWRSFALAAYSKGQDLVGLVVRVGLESRSSGSGEPYQTMQFSVSRVLSPVEKATMVQFGAMVDGLVKSYQSEAGLREVARETIDAEVIDTDTETP